jgi:hypothetical protein
MTDSDNIVSLHLVIPFISMILLNSTANVKEDTSGANFEKHFSPTSRGARRLLTADLDRQHY